jgi:hypothetical protein
MYANAALAKKFQTHVCLVHESQNDGDVMSHGKTLLRSLVDTGLIPRDDFPKALASLQQWMDNRPDDTTEQIHLERFFTLYEEAEFVVPPETL